MLAARVRPCFVLLLLLAAAGNGDAASPDQTPVHFDVVIAELHWPIRSLIAPSRPINHGDFPLAGLLSSTTECADYVKYLDKLQARDRLEILSQPKLVTQNGQQVSFRFSGRRPLESAPPCHRGSIGVNFEEENYGVQIDLLPVLLADGTLRLDVETKLTGTCLAVPIQGEVQRCGPETEWSRLRTIAEMRPGQTLLLAGPDSRCGHCGSAFCRRSNAPYDRYLLLVTPRLAQQESVPSSEPPAKTSPSARSGREIVRSLYWQLQEMEAEVEQMGADVEARWDDVWWAIGWEYDWVRSQAERRILHRDADAR